MKIMQYVLGFFGYVKIPKAVVRLSILQEHSLRQWVLLTKNQPQLNAAMKISLNAQEVLTTFLRSGQLISYRTDEDNTK